MQTPLPTRPESRIAYIRELKVEALPEDLRSQFDGFDQVWGIHNTDGACLALVRDRNTAFFVARENELAPVSAH